MTLKLTARMRASVAVRRSLSRLSGLLVLGCALGLAVGPVHARGDKESDDDGPPINPSQFGAARQPGAHEATRDISDDVIGERPILTHHVDQAQIDNGSVAFSELLLSGQQIFTARFNSLDGYGRPLNTSAGVLRARPPAPYDRAMRTSGPDTSTCTGCHNQPRSGGAGDFNSNLFSGLGAKDPIEFSVSNGISNERNPPSIFGAGAREMLGREMSFDLIAIREAAKTQAVTNGTTVTADLVTKGISFGKITVRPDGLVDPTQIVGCDWDLVIKPLGWAGLLNVRSVAVGGMNLHHGMQAVEKFGLDTDPDGDGVKNELSVGDMTAISVFLAALPIPGRVYPRSHARREAARLGETLFSQVQCATCHTPSMKLNNPVFTEPGPFNQPGNLRLSDVPRPFSFDMTRQGPLPRLQRTKDGGAIVSAFTDLKRHDLNDATTAHFIESQPGGPLNGQQPASAFYNVPNPIPRLSGRLSVTHRLWDVGSTAPYGRRGDITTFTETIKLHGGESAASRDAFFALSAHDQACIIEFMMTLQVVPEGADHEVFDN